MLVDRVESQGGTVFDCGRDEGRVGCRWAGSGGGQSRIKGTASVNLQWQSGKALPPWLRALLGRVVWESGAELALTATKTIAQPQDSIAQRLQWQRGATPSPGAGGSAMGAPCEGVARPTGRQDCAVLRGLRRKRVSGSPAAARRILSFFRSRCAGHSQHRGPSVISQTRCWGLFLPISPRRGFRGLSNSST